MKNTKTMFMTLKRAWTVFEVDEEGIKRNYTIPIGRHAIERIKSPLGESGVWWLVLKGTKKGNKEEWWRQWGSFDEGDHQVVIEER